jgi:hypothetical protein
LAFSDQPSAFSLKMALGEAEQTQKLFRLKAES